MPADRSFTSLQELIDATPGLVSYLYNDTPGPHSRARAGLSPRRQLRLERYPCSWSQSSPSP